MQQCVRYNTGIFHHCHMLHVWNMYLHLSWIYDIGTCSIQASVVTDDHRNEVGVSPLSAQIVDVGDADGKRLKGCGNLVGSGRGWWFWTIFCWILWICVAYVYIVWSYVFASVIPGLKQCGSLTSRCLVLFSSIVICGTTSVFRKLSVWNLQDSSTMWMNTATFYEDWFQVFTAVMNLWTSLIFEPSDD